MIKLAIFSALLASTLATLVIGVQIKCIPLVYSPIEELDKMLTSVDGICAAGLGGYIDKVTQLRQSDGQKFKTCQSLSDVADNFIELKADNVCDPKRIEALAKISQIDRKGFKKSFKEKESSCFRVALRDFTRKTIETCLAQFEGRWMANDGELKKDYELKYGKQLSALDIVSRNYAGDKAQKTKRNDLIEFDGALRRSYNLDKLKYNSGELKVILLRINMNLTGNNYLKANSKNKPRDVSKEEAKEILEDLLLGPCDHMIRRDETQGIVRPVANLIKLIMLDKARLPAADESYLTFQWAARYVACDWFLELDKKELAEMVSRHSMSDLPEKLLTYKQVVSEQPIVNN